MEHKRICKECNKAFIARNVRGTYCSVKCKVAAHRRKLVTVTQNLGEVLNAKNLENRIDDLESEIKAIQEELGNLEIKKQEMDRKVKQERALEDSKRLDLEKKLDWYKNNHGKIKEAGLFTQPGVEQINAGKLHPTAVLPLAFVDMLLGTKGKPYDYKKEIDSITNELKKLNNWNGLFPLAGEFAGNFFRKGELEGLLQTKMLEKAKLEKELQESKRAKSLIDLKDAAGFVSAKSLKYANFSERLRLDGAMGEFLGDLEMDKLAITLLGKPGSGKTYFTFDLMRAFSKLDFTIAYFSLEEGINDLTRTKLEKYGLMEKENIMLIDRGNIEDIKKAASQFKVIIIDSWGKLNAPTDEFDVLRNHFPKTIFISIFQQTSSGAMRGGTKAAFDAGINIETYKDGEERIATCAKNRYGMAGLKYGINESKILE